MSCRPHAGRAHRPTSYQRASRAASSAKATVHHDGQELAFTVADDGNGFDQATTRMGSGVQGICDRIVALGGAVQITSAPGQGTRLHGRVPAAAS